MPETETIDKLFLELSHVTKARTLRENVYAKAISETIDTLRTWMHEGALPKDVRERRRRLLIVLANMGDDREADHAD